MEKRKAREKTHVRKVTRTLARTNSRDEARSGIQNE